MWLWPLRLHGWSVHCHHLFEFHIKNPLPPTPYHFSPHYHFMVRPPNRFRHMKHSCTRPRVSARTNHVNANDDRFNGQRPHPHPDAPSGNTRIHTRVERARNAQGTAIKVHYESDESQWLCSPNEIQTWAFAAALYCLLQPSIAIHTRRLIWHECERRRKMDNIFLSGIGC